jgi:hypothetical protein
MNPQAPLRKCTFEDKKFVIPPVFFCFYQTAATVFATEKSTFCAFAFKTIPF